MADFMKILNEELRALAEKSESIATLPEEEKAAYVERISVVDDETAAKLVEVFKKEAVDLEAARATAAKGTEEKIALLDNLLAELANIKRSFEFKIRDAAESEQKKTDEKIQEELLTKLKEL